MADTVLSDFEIKSPATPNDNLVAVRNTGGVFEDVQLSIDDIKAYVAGAGLADGTYNNATVVITGGKITNVSSGSAAGIPTVTAGTAAGTGATAMLLSGSTDSAGYIQITTGSVTAIGTLAKLTFSAPYGSSPNAIVGAATANAGSVLLFSPKPTGSAAIDINAGIAATGGGTIYIIAYSVTP